MKEKGTKVNCTQVSILAGLRKMILFKPVKNTQTKNWVKLKDLILTPKINIEERVLKKVRICLSRLQVDPHNCIHLLSNTTPHQITKTCRIK